MQREATSHRPQQLKDFQIVYSQYGYIEMRLFSIHRSFAIVLLTQHLVALYFFVSLIAISHSFNAEPRFTLTMRQSTFRFCNILPFSGTHRLKFTRAILTRQFCKAAQESMTSTRSGPWPKSYHVGKIEEEGTTSTSSEIRTVPCEGVGKRKMAIVCGYVGSEYNGLQIDTTGHFKTIEGEIVMALLAAGLVSEPNSVDITKIGWSRSSRTDKGVHAARIVLSMKLLVHKQWISKTHSPLYVHRINKHLPSDIRVFSLRKVNQGFRAREAGSWREYEYLIPQKIIDDRVDEFNRILVKYEGSKSFHNFHRVANRYLLKSKRQGLNMTKSQESNVRQLGVHGSHVVSHEGKIFSREIVQGENEGALTDRVAQEQGNIGTVTSVFDDWKPTERVSGPFTIKNMYACRVVNIFEINGEPMVSVRIKGQSFLLHQIRLMLGAAIMICNKHIPEAALDCALACPYFIPFPMAPPHGLILKSAGFGMNCDGTDYAMTTQDGLDTQIDNILLTPEDEAKSDQFLVQRIHNRVLQDWKADELSENSWMQYHSKRYSVNQALFKTFTELAAEGSVASEQKRLKVRERHLENAESFIRKKISRREFISEHMSHNALLPPGLSTEIAVHFDTAPSLIITKALKFLAIRVLEGDLPLSMTSKDVLRELGDMEGVKRCALRFDKLFQTEIAALQEEKRKAKQRKRSPK